MRDVREWLNARESDRASVRAYEAGNSLLAVMVQNHTARITPTTDCVVGAIIGVCLDRGIMPWSVVVPDTEDYVTVTGWWRDRDVKYEFAVDAYRKLAPEFWCELTDYLGRMYGSTHDQPWIALTGTVGGDSDEN
jgi:hypothetical protein